MADVERITTPCKVYVVTRIFFIYAVIDLVINTLSKEYRSQRITFPCMVINNIKNDFNPRFIESLYHFLNSVTCCS